MATDLPLPVWENDELKYKLNQYFHDGSEKELETNNLFQAFEEIMGLNFYYSFNCDVTIIYKDGTHEEKKDCHNHAHSFEEVVNALYVHPVSFNIKEEDKEWYSNQELEYLNILKKFLIGAGRKDVDKLDEKVCKNKYVHDFAKYYYTKESKDICERLVNGEEIITKHLFPALGTSNSKTKKVLIDEDYKFYGVVEFEFYDVNSVNIEELDYEEYGYESREQLLQVEGERVSVTEKISLIEKY